MNVHAKVEIGHSVCPHDCPSICALDVEVIPTAGSAACTARRTTATRPASSARRSRATPSASTTPTGSCTRCGARARRARANSSASPGTRRSTSPPRRFWRPSAATARRRCGPTSTPARWASSCATGSTGCATPSAIPACTGPSAPTLAWTGYIAGTGRLAGADPREMAKSDLVVIWGTNAVNTQVNVMTHATRARKERGAKIVAIDIYHNGTMQQADLGPVPAARHRRGARLRRDARAVPRRLADWPYLEQYTDCPRELEAHLADPHAGMGERDHRAQRRRDRGVRQAGRHDAQAPTSGSATASPASATAPHNMHAALCIPAVTGAWRNEGGGGFHNNGAIYNWNKTLIEGLDVADPNVRVLDQSRIGPVLTGDRRRARRRPAVTALLIQNTNPVLGRARAAEGKAGFAREDLFTCVHEQFMTDDRRNGRHRAAGHDVPGARRHLPGRRPPAHSAGAASSIEPPGECRSNHEVICALAPSASAPSIAASR